MASPNDLTDAVDEDGEGLAQPELGRRPPPGSWLGRPRTTEPVPEVEEEVAPEWTGPRVQLGYLHYVLSDGYGGGNVHAGSFAGYLPTGHLRLGASAHAGTRDYALGATDFLLVASAIVGYQHLNSAPFVPYVGLTGTVGVLLGKRFHTPVSQALGGAGVEIGLDAILLRSLHTEVGLGYTRATLEGVGVDLYTLRLRIGL